MAHVKQCYKIRYEKVKKQRKEQGNYKYLLAKSVDCEFPQMPPLESLEEIKSDDDLFDEDKVNELYENEPKADA